MNSPIHNIENRRPVWKELSELFLDTQLEDSYFKSASEKLALSPYSENELDDILETEVAPVLHINLSVWVIAGVWDGFDDDSVAAHILKQQESWFHRFWNRTWFSRWQCSSKVKNDWLRLKKLIQEKRCV